MLGAILAWASGMFRAPTDESAPKQKTLWALVIEDDYMENQPIFLKANSHDCDIDVALAAKRDYFSVVGVPAKNWTYSTERPTEEPAGHRWIPLEAGFGLRLRI